MYGCMPSDAGRGPCHHRLASVDAWSMVGLAEIRSRFGDKYQFLYIVTEERQYIETDTYRLNQLYETGTYRLKSAVRDQLYERLLKCTSKPGPRRSL